MGAYQRTIWPNGLTTLLRRAGDQRQYEALRAFYMEELSSSVKVRGGTADPSASSNRLANSPMLGQFRSVEIQARRDGDQEIHFVEAIDKALFGPWNRVDHTPSF